MRVSREQALAHLQTSLGADAEFRPQQWEAIDKLVNDRRQLLLVQRTGWGKSTVYFIATRLLRDQGAGPTLIISPLLSLMRNQVQDAEADLDLEAVTINSNNEDEWSETAATVVNGECDLLLVSPERLANRTFRDDVLAEMEDSFGMVVVDEAHCISDWGHDFRPDYRRIRRLIERLPADVPVAATTATANDRVVEDITTQLPGIEPLRGHLVRDSLRIQTITMEDRDARLAWLAEYIPELPHSGIVYCLTIEDVETVATWLSAAGIDARPYHGRLDGDEREEREQQLLENDVDVLVATNSLGMGFNKPDLGFVIHFQRPPNLIRYYQEIGRAGRNLEEAYAVMLSGSDDDDIAEYFIEQAFPAEAEFLDVLTVLSESEEPLYQYQIQKRLNIAYGVVDTVLDMLRLDGAIERVSDGYVPTGEKWVYDDERVQRVTEQRWQELRRIQEFAETDTCLTRFIDDELDGELAGACGQCANCAGDFFPRTPSDDGVAAAQAHYRAQNTHAFDSRKRLPLEPDAEKSYTTLETEKQLAGGYVLSKWDDPGWGHVVRDAVETGAFDEALVTAAADVVSEEWQPDPFPEWVTVVPSTSNQAVLTKFTQQLSSELDLPFVDCVTQIEATAPQYEMENWYQQYWNIKDAFEVADDVRGGPVLLVDDDVMSRWTMTEIGKTLREAGSGPVYAFALAERHEK